MNNIQGPVLILKSLCAVRGTCVPSLAGVIGNRMHFLIRDSWCQRTNVDVFSCTQVLFSSNVAKERFLPNPKFVAKNDPDTFGNMRMETSEGDEGDLVEEEYLTYPPRRGLRIKQYAEIIKAHLRNKEFAAAIDVLETRMLKEDKVKPDAYIYSLLIGACGRIGYTRKAFRLYNQMKQRGLKVNGAVYTGLINSCANSPFPDRALKEVKHVQGIMLEKGIEPNVTHYNAMIKAYGRCGDIAGAFKLVDEMVDHKMEIKSDTFSFLFQACVSDTEAGFRHAVLVWHKMIKKGLKPNVFLFNLVLRCVRDCGLGATCEAEKILQQLTAGGNDLTQSETREFSSSCERSRMCSPMTIEDLSLKTAAETSETGHEEDDFTNVSSVGFPNQVNHPNLLAPQPRLGNIVAVSTVTEPQDRLLLLGGCVGVLNCMEQFNVLPDIKTFTLLLDCIPPTLSAEKALLAKVKKLGIKLDIDFFNMLIKKRSFRCDYDKARDVLRMISAEKLLPDIVTFGVLALSCKTKEQAQEVINDMKFAGFRVNQEILGAMLSQACYYYNFKYAIKILYLVKEEEIKLTPRFIQIVDEFIEKCQKLRRQKVEGEAVPAIVRDPSFKTKFNKFLYQYKAWLVEMGGRESFKEPHPWEQFQKR